MRSHSLGRRGRWRWWAAAAALLVVVLLGVAGCSMLGGEFAPEVATPEMAAQALQSRFVDDDDGAIHYVVAGREGTPLVLFVHGSPGTWEAWRGYLTDGELSRKARLVALDRPGFGGTQRGRAEPSLVRQAAAVAAVARAEGGGPGIVVGHSLGGPIAAELAAGAPELVSGLLLIAPSIDPTLEQLRWYNVAGSLVVVQWLLPRDLITSNRELWPLRAELERLTPRLAGIRAPVVVIQGGKDSLVPPGNADFAARAFSGTEVELQLLPEATHFVVWQDPRLVVRAIVELLGRTGADPNG
ncbi:MAG TPA: alpha/beta hydrolase [Thermoanaerobaculia bacterium]|nr:alpha/beta hydrolase [Thermoanaerobaculia bacterium]